MPRLGQRPVVFDCEFKGTQCTATSKLSGERCRNYACQGRHTCRMHGGTSRRGRDHPNYKSGKYSTVLKGAVRKFRRLLKRPVQVRLALYPEGLSETLARPRQERYFVTIEFPTDLPDLPAQERILAAARRELTVQLRLLREELAVKFRTKGVNPESEE
jgi:hypothetical protein